VTGQGVSSVGGVRSASAATSCPCHQAAGPGRQALQPGEHAPGVAGPALAGVSLDQIRLPRDDHRLLQPGALDQPPDRLELLPIPASPRTTRAPPSPPASAVRRSSSLLSSAARLTIIRATPGISGLLFLPSMQAPLPGSCPYIPVSSAARPPLRIQGFFYASLGPDYENVHRGQSSASAAMTARFEESYDTIARFIGAPGPASIALYRNATEAVNAVMYSLLTEFRDGDNVVTTLMEHNSNYVPWYAMCREILPRFGRRVQCRLARFDPVSGELDLEHLASLIDARTKLVCCTGASNFLGTRNPLGAVRALADASGYYQPNGERRSWLLIDGAQLVPGSFTDVHALGADYLAFSFHKLLAPFGIGVLYAREQLLDQTLPFLYGGDMIAEGRVFPNHVEYNALPWKYSAGTPNILGAIVSAQAVRLLLDLALTPKHPAYFGTARPGSSREPAATVRRWPITPSD
jgi:hypothetical protein